MAAVASDVRSSGVQYAFDRHVAEISDGLLSADEQAGLTACLPRLADLAHQMGVLERPVNEWTGPEMLRFLTLAVRAAVPLRAVSYHDPNMNDRMPF